MSAATGASTPAWLLTAQPGLCSCTRIGVRTRTSFTERTLGSISSVMREVLFSEEVARRPGLLQRVDARAKVVAVAVLLVAVALLRNVPSLVAAYVAVVVLAASLGVGVRSFLARVWLAVGVFTAVAMLPGIFSFVRPGELALTLWTWDGHPQGITVSGLTTAALVVLRAATSVSLVLILTLTTPWAALLAALGSLGLPAIIVMIVQMAYRYLFLLLGVAGDLYTARRARTVAGRKADASARSFIGASTGVLIGHSGHLATQVHESMVARGFQGRMRTLDSRPLRWADATWAIGALGVAVLLTMGDRFLG